MKTILLPTDFSTPSEQAADFAISLAQLVKAQVVVLNVIQLVPDAYNIPMSSSPLMVEAEKMAETSMDEFKENLLLKNKTNANNFPAITTKIVYGNVSSTIIETADELKADFIVIGSVGADNTLGKLFGSNTVRVTKHAHCPVWVIPQKTNLLAIKSMIYLTDLAGEEVELLHKIIDIAELLGANLKAVHVHDAQALEVYSSKAIISQIKEDLHGKPVVFKNLLREDLVKGMDTYIKNQKPDVIVIAHEERSLLETFFHHSVIKHLALTSHTPLLILQKKW